MTPATPPTTPPSLPGGWDVGAALHVAWDHVLVTLVPLLIVAVGVLVVLASGKGASARSEWQEWLVGRSGTHGDE